MNTLILAAAVFTNGVAELESVTVYATRIDQTKERVPAQVEVYSGKELDSPACGGIAEFLSRRSLVDVHSMNGNPLFSSVASRGFGQNGFARMKILLDGEELNNVDMSEPNLTRIPLDCVERVEVLHGPNPVLYGDGAIAGVVNVTTRREDYAEATRLALKSGSWNTFGANFRTKGGDEERAVNYNASYDYVESDGFRDRSAYRMHTANAGVRRRFENGSHIALRSNYQNAFYELPGALSYGEWKNSRRSAAYYGDWARLHGWALSIDSKIKMAEDRWLCIDAGFSDQYRRAVYKSSRSDLEYFIRNYRFSTRYLDENAVCGIENRFTAGFDFRYDDYDAPGAPRFDRYRHALFAYDEFSVTEKFSLVAGARLEFIENDWSRSSGLAESRSGDREGDFELGAVYRPFDGFKSYFKAARFHRSAFCDEMNYTRDGKFLKPETGYSLDAGFEWNFADEFTVGLNAYASLMKDEIFFDPAVLPWGYNVNSPDDTRRVGLDAWASWEREKTADISIRCGVVDAGFAGGMYDGNDVPYVPNCRAGVNAGYWLWDEVKIGGGMSFFSSRYPSGDYANAADKLKGYVLFDISAYYEPCWAKGLKFSLTLSNLFDRNYCDWAGVGYYYPACGRSVSFTVSYEF